MKMKNQPIRTKSDSAEIHGYTQNMATLRHIHRYMTNRQKVRLDDGRIGKIVRVDTEFPKNRTTVSIWINSESGPGVAKVDMSRVLGVANDETKSA